MKRARSELDESCQLEVKRLRVSNHLSQGKGEGGTIVVIDPRCLVLWGIESRGP